MRNRKRNRMKGYDYSSDNLYFVTICVDKMNCYLGEIVDVNSQIPDNKILNLNPKIASNIDLNSNSELEGTTRELSVRHKIPNNSNSNKESSNQIMQVNNYGQIVLERLQWLADQYKYVVIHSHIVMPNHIHAIIEIDSLLIPDVGIKIKSLSELVGAFKSTSSKLIHDLGLLDFKWKRSFHDTIIKDDKAFNNISKYIINNAMNWKSDCLNPVQ